MAIDRNLIFDNIDTTNTTPYPIIFSADSNGKLWASVYIGGNTEMKYSTDNGLNWTSESNPFASGDKFPSIFIDNSDALHIVTSEPTVVNSPKWNKMNGSWAGSEIVKSDVNGGNDSAVVVVTGSQQPFCFWRNNDAVNNPTRTIRARRRNGSWGTEHTTNITSNSWQTWSLSATIDSESIFHLLWYEQEIADSTHKKIVHATYDGSAFSKTTILDYNSTVDPIPRIVATANREIWITWRRDGIGTYTTKSQIQYRIYTTGIGWGSVQTLTDFDGDHAGADVIFINDYIICAYAERGSYASQPTIYNLVYQTYERIGENWSDKVQLTEENYNQIYPNITSIGNDIYISFWAYDGANYDLYCGSFTPTTPSTAKEIYDYVDTISADVDVTLSLDPQVVIPEVGGKGDIIHLADDESEERIGYSSDFNFYITIRYDLLNESDAGTLLDIWADSSKANGRVNSWKFVHPDGHTYVVRFDTDLTRLVSPTYYTVKNIRLKILGRIADS